jgi:hypothetical protein
MHGGGWSDPALFRAFPLNYAEEHPMSKTTHILAGQVFNRTTQTNQQVDVDVTIDWVALAQLMAQKVKASKRGKTVQLGGIIKAKIR